MMRYTGPNNVTPPDGFRYTFPDGVTIRQSCRGDWYNAIRRHAEMNGYELAENWKDLADDQFCLLMPPGWCSFDDGSDVLSHINTRLEMGDLFRGMEVLLRIAASPDPLVDQETAERRGAICAACPVNITVPGCIPCMKIPDMVAKIVGAKTTQSDPYLRTCGICKCMNAAAIWVKPEILAHGVTPGQMDQYARLGHCWKYKELKALE